MVTLLDYHKTITITIKQVFILVKGPHAVRETAVIKEKNWKYAQYNLRTINISMKYMRTIDVFYWTEAITVCL